MLGGDELLFDLTADPYEQHDLSDRGDKQTLKAELIEILAAEIAAVRPEYLEDGRLPKSDPPDLDALRGFWPGFHSREKIKLKNPKVLIA